MCLLSMCCIRATLDSTSHSTCSFFTVDIVPQASLEKHNLDNIPHELRCMALVFCSDVSVVHQWNVAEDQTALMRVQPESWRGACVRAPPLHNGVEATIHPHRLLLKEEVVTLTIFVVSLHKRSQDTLADSCQKFSFFQKYKLRHISST